MSTLPDGASVTTSADHRRAPVGYTHLRCNKALLPKLRRLAALRTARLGRRITNGHILEELVTAALGLEDAGADPIGVEGLEADQPAATPARASQDATVAAPEPEPPARDDFLARLRPPR